MLSGVLAGLLVIVTLTSAATIPTGSHWIVLPKYITQMEPTPITFNFYNTTEDVLIQVDLLHDTHNSLYSVQHTFTNGESDTLTIPALDLLSLNWTGSPILLVHGLKGLYFTEEARLTYRDLPKQERFTMLVQTDKAIYKPGQTVHFRAFGMFDNMTVHTGLMDIHVYDPKHNHIKQVINASEPKYGVVEDFLLMDDEPILGDWEIRVSSKGLGSGSKTFTVDKYVLPKFEASVELPNYVLTTDTEVHGTVKAKYTYGKPVIGSVHLKADLDYYANPWKYHGDEVMVETTFDIDGEAKFTIPLDRISSEVDPNTFIPLVKKLNGYHLSVTVEVTESLNNLSRNATGSVLFYEKPYIVNFNSQSSPQYFKPGLPYTAYVTISQPDGRPVISSARDVRVVTYVRFYDNSVHKTRAFSLPDRYMAPPATGVLQIDVDPPEFAQILHLEVEYKGFVVKYSASKPSWLLQNSTMSLFLNSSSTSKLGDNVSFNLISVEPLEKIYYLVIANSFIVHTGEQDASGATDAVISFPVTPRMEPYAQLIVYFFTSDGVWDADSLYFNVNQGSALFKNKVSVGFDKASVEPGDNITLSVNTDPHSLVNVLAVDQSVLLLKGGNDVTQRDVVTAFRSATAPQVSTSSSFHNPQNVMQTTGMQVLTDVHGFSWLHHYKRQIPPGCEPINGIGTGTDTNGSGTQLAQVQRTRTLFPETWLWTKVTSGADGRASIAATVPDTITSWVATAFSVNAHSGLGIVDGPATFKTFRPFFVSLNLPISIIRGEEVILQANIFNYMGQDLNVVVTLEKSNDFVVVSKGPGGVMNYDSISVQKTVTIPAGKAGSVFIPIVASIVGVTDIAVKAQSVLAADGVKRQLIVEAEGAPMFFNIPRIINGDSKETISISFPTNVVADSQKIHVSAIGDVMGPTVKNVAKLIRLPTGCGEQTMMSLAPDVFVYNYLQKTNQLTDAIKEKAVDYMHRGYQRELKYQHTDGSFSVWGQSDHSGSMWLTAFVVKSFHQANQFIFVDNNVLSRAIQWIVRQQAYDGHFPSVGYVSHTMLKGGVSSQYSMTAFVLIALIENGDSTSSAQYSAAKARAYLEAHVREVNSMYDLAIVSYALAKSGSSIGAVAYAKLDKLATVTGGLKYWKKSNPYNNGWMDYYSRHAPVDIEITSYALLYLIETKQFTGGLPLLRWLATQRNSLGGFRSTQDTVLGLQAMSEFGGVLNGTLTIDVTSGNFTKQFSITKQDALVLKTLEIPMSSLIADPAHPGSSQILLQSHGQGSALTQVSVSFHVEKEVTDPAFNMSVNIVHETLRSLVIETCARVNGSIISNPGMSVVEFGVPTGFTVEMESSLTKLEDVKKTETKNQILYIYYDTISTIEDTCATIEMIRTDLVAKTKPATIKVYDYYDPDNQAMSFYESTLLKDSTFCDICANCGCHP